MNPKNPTSRKNQEHEDSGRAVYRIWCAACVEGRGVGGQRQIELLEEEERERTTSFVAFDYGFMTQESAGTLPILICRDGRYGQTGATCVNGKVPQHTPFHFLRVAQISWCSQLHFEMRQRTEHEITARCGDSSMCGSGSDPTRTT